MLLERLLSLLPSEYFKRQCWVSFEPEEWNLAACAEFLGADRVVWASDYPHPEYHEGVVDEVRASVAPLAAGAVFTLSRRSTPGRPALAVPR